MIDIKIIRHATLKSCLKEYGIDPNSKGHWEWADADGIKHRTRKATAYSSIQKRKCWGWTENKKRIHVWIGKKATLGDVIDLLAHEFGHTNRPFYRDVFLEEQKAAKYAAVSNNSLAAAQELLASRTQK